MSIVYLSGSMALPLRQCFSACSELFRIESDTVTAQQLIFLRVRQAREEEKAKRCSSEKMERHTCCGVVRTLAVAGGSENNNPAETVAPAQEESELHAPEQTVEEHSSPDQRESSSAHDTPSLADLRLQQEVSCAT
jgi:hypothetical protein